MKRWIGMLGGWGICCSFVGFAQPRTFSLSLAEAESRAIAISLEVKQAEAQIQMSSESLRAQDASKHPRLSLDGNYRYLSEVPEARLGPQVLSFGQHHNYSIGPMLSYEIYDGGGDRKASESIAHLLKAKQRERDVARLKTVLDTRLAYNRVQVGIEELRLVNASLRTLQARLKDARQRLQVGSASRLELLSVQREELQLRLRYAQTQSSLAESTRRLAVLIGDNSFAEDLHPVGSDAGTPASGIAAPDLILKLDPIGLILRRVRGGVNPEPNAAHPSLVVWKERVDAARLEGESRNSEAQPKVQAFVKSSYDYPNGPKDETVWQNSVGLSVSLTLYDGGLRQGLTAQKRAEAQVHEVQKALVQRDFEESWRNAKAHLASLQEQRDVMQKAVERAEQEAQLTYGNFQAGALNYLEVQRANNQVLEAQTALARLDAQVFSQYATLNFLSAHSEIKP